MNLKTDNVRWKGCRRTLSVSDLVGKKFTDEVWILHWRIIYISKTVKSCSVYCCYYRPLKGIPLRSTDLKCVDTIQLANSNKVGQESMPQTLWFFVKPLLVANGQEPTWIGSLIDRVLVLGRLIQITCCTTSNYNSACLLNITSCFMFSKMLHDLLRCLLSYVIHQHKQKGEIRCYAFYLICIIVLQVIFHVHLQKAVYYIFFFF